ncbi:ABC transporter permease [Sutcliffiella horikoshii]|uniref:ABC transporter permease n=1 Tax=Sutcliffiella horikoshii TaxID=79883 RepID=UPI0007D0ACF0|nr:ABC transporter permease [Sutcliffiella horikoshii]MCM3618342.1 ABC transporter permease [Sutcliffiella horikoshii]
MNFIKRGLLSITRNKGKSIILLLVIFVLGNLISGAISIQQATGNVETSIKEKLGAATTVELDYEALNEMSEEEMMEYEIKNLDLDLIKKIGGLSYVKYYDYNTNTYLGSKTLKSYRGEHQEDFEEHEMDDSFISMDFNIKGINYAPVLDFEEQKSKLIDGRVFQTEEIENGSSVAIISKKLAEKNSLQIGDTFVLNSEIYGPNSDKPTTIRDVVLEVIGFFEPQTVKKEEGSNKDQGMYDWMDMDLQNTIYVPNEVVIAENKAHMEEYMKDPEFAEMMENEEQFEYYTPIFVLNKPEDSASFEEEVKPLLPDLYTVRKASDQYENIAAPIQSMSKLSNYVLIAAIITTVLIIGLVVLLFLRDRKRELGIYLSLGERRGRLVGQIILEVMIISLIGITLSLFTGNYLAQGISDTMINTEKGQSNDDHWMYPNSGIHSNLTTDDVIASYQVTLDASFIFLFYGVGIATILLSTILPLIYIIRLNPRKIMM